MKSPIQSRESSGKLYLDFEETIKKVIKEIQGQKLPGQDTVRSLFNIFRKKYGKIRSQY